MITRIEALDFRCLRYVSRPLKPFHVLVGPNASGKTTFLDVVALLGRLVSDGPEAALPARSGNFKDLVFGREGQRLELAVECMFQSLSSTYDAQILVATHSPVILSVAEASDVLCFAKTHDGATDIVLGSEHPALADWQGETNLGVLFAGGVLG